MSPTAQIELPQQQILPFSLGNRLFDDGQDSNNTNSPTFVCDDQPSWLSRLFFMLNEKLVVNFTPVFFASVMGTGICSNILYNFPFPAKWLQVCGIIFSVVCLVLFLSLTALMIFALYKDSHLWYRIHRDPVHAPAMGCFVMGFITLVNMLHSLTEKSWIYAVWVLWWVAVFGSVYTAFLTFFFSVVGKHRKRENVLKTSNISLAFLLPVVTLTVCAALGGSICPDLPKLNMKITTMVLSFVMWAIAVILAFIVVLVNFWRMFVHKIPATGQVFTMFLPIGFLGQGAYAILLFGRNCVGIIMENSNNVASSSYTSFLHEAANSHNQDLSNLPVILSTALLATSTMFAASLMAFGYFFTFLAFASVLSKMQPFARKPNTQHIYDGTEGNIVQRLFSGFLRFNRGFWSMTFPLGTMSLCNGEMYNLYKGMEAFRYISTIYACILISITLGCLCGVAYNFVKMVITSMRPATSKEMV